MKQWPIKGLWIFGGTVVLLATLVVVGFYTIRPSLDKLSWGKLSQAEKVAYEEAGKAIFQFAYDPSKNLVSYTKLGVYVRDAAVTAAMIGFIVGFVFVFIAIITIAVWAQVAIPDFKELFSSESDQGDPPPQFEEKR